MSIWHTITAAVTCPRCGTNTPTEFDLYHSSFYDNDVRDSVLVGESLGQEAYALHLIPLRDHGTEGDTVNVLDWWECRTCFGPDPETPYLGWALITLVNQTISHGRRRWSHAVVSAVEAVEVTEASFELADAATHWAIKDFVDEPQALKMTYDPQVTAQIRERLRTKQLPLSW